MTPDEQWQAAQGYVGRAYVPGVYDCAHLAADVQREVFGRAIHLPTRHAKGRAGQAAQINAHRTLAEHVQAPVHGGAVLFTSCGDGGELWHIGTVFVRAEPWVLHNSAVMGSACLQRLKDFPARGQRIEGFYKWT